MFYTNVTKRGNFIHHIGYNDRGKRFHFKEPFEPSIYYEVQADTDESRSIYGNILRKRTFENISEWYKFVQTNKDLIELYGNIDPSYQFIAQQYKDNVKYTKEYIRTWFIDIEVMSEDGFPHAHEAKWPIVSITIYDTRRDEYIILGLKDYEYDFNRLKLNTEKVTYKRCATEKDLMTKFIELNTALAPDIWVAHNGEGFDFPYIINRVDNIGLSSNDLSPVGKASSKYTEVEDKFTSGKSEYYNSISGISLIDNMLIYKKYVSEPRESYGLSNLGVEELEMDKLNYAEYDNLNALYEQNHTKFIDYNIVDVYIMVMLNKKRRYLDIHIRNSFKAKASNFEECMSPVKLWDIYVYQTLQKKNIQIPPMKKDIVKFSYPGAWVVEPIVGIHKWVIPFDIASLYPHIQMQWRISPECLVSDLTVTDWLQSLTIKQIDDFIDKSTNPEQIKFLNDLKQLNEFGYAITPIDREQLDERILNKLIPTHPNYIMTANGFYFRKDITGCISELLLENYNERKNIKSEMEILKIQQNKSFDKIVAETLDGMKVAEQGIKIMMNAEYGALANEFFRYCKYELCSSITMNGQLIIKSLLNNIVKYFPEMLIIAGDTDSCYFGFENMINKYCHGFDESQTISWINEFCKNELQMIIDQTFQEISDYVGAPKNFIKMVREKVLSDAFWTAKKHYAYRMVVEDDIILSKPKFGYKGLECVKSSIPKAVRAQQKRMIQTILERKDIGAMMIDCKNIIMKLSPEDIAFPKTCNGLYKYSDGKGGWIKGAQAHVKAAMTYNKFIKDRKLINEYPLIKEGEKIRFVWMKTPNLFNSETFGFLNRLPKDDMILEYIDYDTLYYKCFEKVITDILDRLNLKMAISKTNSLEDYF